MSASAVDPGEERSLEQLRAARASGQRTPDFFIVGHAKCGTTALYEMLQPHPQIYMCTPKELQFLSRWPHHRPRAARGAPDPRPRTLEDYLARFAQGTPAQRVGEGSTEYLRSDIAPSRIAALCPQARIIAMFREPVSFLRSLHLQLLQVRIEDEPSFEKALALEPERREGRHLPRDSPWPPTLRYSEHVRYTEQLRRYHEHFGREQVLTLIYDDFRRDNQDVVKQVLRFLEVDDTVELQAAEANPTVRVRSHRAQSLVQAVSMGRGPLARAAKGTVQALTSERLRRGALSRAQRIVVARELPTPDERFIAELRRRFKPEVLAASDYLGRDLVSLWGYEQVG